MRERPIDPVRRDAIDGKVTVAAAMRKYGVAVDPQTRTVDRPAAEKPRRRARH